LLRECRFSSAWSVLLQRIKRLPFFAMAVLSLEKSNLSRFAGAETPNIVAGAETPNMAGNHVRQVWNVPVPMTII
jgi:hypothetical protein